MPRTLTKQIIFDSDVDDQLNDMSDNDQDSGYESGSVLDANHISDVEDNGDDLEEDTNSGPENDSDSDKITNATNAASKRQEAKKVFNSRTRKASDKKPDGTAKSEARPKPRTTNPQKQKKTKETKSTAKSKTMTSPQTIQGKATTKGPKSAAKSNAKTKPKTTTHLRRPTKRKLANSVPSSKAQANLWGDDPIYDEIIQKAGAFIVGLVVVLVELSTRHGETQQS